MIWRNGEIDISDLLLTGWAAPWRSESWFLLILVTASHTGRNLFITDGHVSVSSGKFHKELQLEALVGQIVFIKK